MINYESVDKVLKDAFIPQQQTTKRFDFLEDMLPMIKYAADKKRQKLAAAQQSQQPVISQQTGAAAQQTPNILPLNVTNTDAYALIQKYFPKEEWNNAYRVMMGESGGRPGAIGDNYPIRGKLIPSYGLFQIRGFPDRGTPEQLLDPDYNVRYAAQLWKSQGWNPWTVARKLGLPGTKPLK